MTVHPDQTSHSAAFGLDPHCLFRPIQSSMQSEYDNLIKLIHHLRNHSHWGDGKNPRLNFDIAVTATTMVAFLSIIFLTLNIRNCFVIFLRT